MVKLFVLKLILRNAYGKQVNENQKKFWQYVVTINWVNIGLGNDVLRDGTRPSPGPTLSSNQSDPVPSKGNHTGDTPAITY